MTAVLGDGVAGHLVAQQLRALGHTAQVHGDGAAATQPCALVHRYAGRSFRRTPIEEQAWAVAREWLDTLVSEGLARSMEIARPVASKAGARLLKSVSHAVDVRREVLPAIGDALVYGPAYVVDVSAVFARWSSEADEPAVADVLATGARWTDASVARYGGHLAVFEWGADPLDFVVSGGGVHVAPFRGGACVGATFWDESSPLATDAAVDDLRARAQALGVRLGDVRTVWCGFRAVTADRVPVVGMLDGQLVIGGLGTRGWFWAALCARVAARHFALGEPIPAELCVQRFGGRT